MDTLETGEIDYAHFGRELAAHKDRPAIVNVNVGTTVKGAVDDLDRILEVLEQQGFSEDRFFIHCDGALFGLMVRALTEHTRGPSIPTCAARNKGFLSQDSRGRIHLMSLKQVVLALGLMLSRSAST